MWVPRLRTICLAVYAVAVLARVGAIASGSSDSGAEFELPDEVQYWDMARGLAEGRGLRDELGFRATRMPLYPAFVALFVNLENGRLAVLLAQALLAAAASCFTAWLAYQIPQAPSRPGAVRAREVLALIAGLIVALDPFLVYFSRFLLTENLFICALCAFMAVSWKTAQKELSVPWWRWIASGLVFAGCVYLRPSCLGFLVLWSVFVAVRRRFDRAGLGGVASLWLILALALLPWAKRNHTVTGEWTLLTNRAGISLYDGVNPGATGKSDLGAIKNMPAVAGLGENEWDAYFRHESFKAIQNDPGRILRLALTKLARTWSLWPNAPEYQATWIKLASGDWTILVLLSAMLGVFMRREDHSAVIGLLLPAIYFTALHMLFVGSVRYRLPAMPMLEVLSAVGITLMLAKMRWLKLCDASAGCRP